MEAYERKIQHHRKRSESHAKRREMSRNESEAIGAAKSFNVYEAISIEKGKE